MPGPRSLYERIVREGVGRPLLAAGFSPAPRRTWLRHLGADVTWAVDVQAHRFPPPDTTSFTVNWGILLPRARALAGASEVLSPGAGLLQGRLSHVAKQDQDRDWWCDVGPNAGDAEIRDVSTRVNEDLLPFLAAFHSLRSVVDLAEEAQVSGERRLLAFGSPGAAELTVAALVMTGEIDRARGLVARLARKPHVPHLEMAQRLLPKGSQTGGEVPIAPARPYPAIASVPC